MRPIVAHVVSNILAAIAFMIAGGTIQAGNAPLWVALVVLILLVVSNSLDGIVREALR